MISTIITSGGAGGSSSQAGNSNNNGGGNGGGGGGVAGGSLQQQSSSSMYDRDPRHTQVKTYTDHGNGLRSGGSSTQYSKVGHLESINFIFYHHFNPCLLRKLFNAKHF